MQQQASLAFIPVSKIRPNPDALREVNKETEKYVGLVQSIKEFGVTNPILVSPSKTETGEDVYTLCDGLHRFSGACDAGLESIPAQIMTLSQYELYEAQIVGNLQKVETKPVEYAKALVRLLAMKPTMTKSELCARMGFSEKWLNDRLSLTKIQNPEIQKLIDDDQLPLSNAYFLAKLPFAEHTQEWVQRAMTENTQEFGAAVTARVNEIRKAEAEGRKANPPVFTPVARLRKLSEVAAATKDPAIIETIKVQNSVQSLESAILAGIKWVMMMDSVGQAEQHAKNEQRKRDAEEAKARREKERNEKKAAQSVSATTGVVTA